MNTTLQQPFWNTNPFYSRVKKLSFFVLIVFGLIAPIKMAAQVFFDKKYSNVFDLRMARQTSDGGFIACGTSSFSGSNDMCLIKTDAVGNTNWMKAYGNGTQNEKAEAVMQTLDGGYAVVGAGATTQIGFFIKTNSSGVTQWFNKYLQLPNGGFNSILQLADSSYILTSGTIVSNQWGALTHLDKNGNIIWSTRINPTPSAINTMFSKAFMLPGGDFIAVGEMAGNQLALRFTSSGTIVWMKTYNSGYFFDALQTTDGNIACTGYAGGIVAATKIDINGNVLWGRTYQIAGHSTDAACIVQNAVGELILLARGSNTVDPCTLIKTDAFGNFLVAKKMSNISYLTANTTGFGAYMTPTSDGGFILAQDNVLKKVMSDVVSTCGISTITLTPNTVTATAINATYAVFSPTMTSSDAYIEIPVAMSNTTSCSTSILSASSSQTNASCFGQCNGSATVTPSGGTSPYTYSWSPGGQTTSIIGSLCAGSYTCKVTDAVSSTVNVIVTISQPSALTITATTSSSSICSGSSTTLSSTGSGGTGAITYTWQPGNLTSSNVAVSPTINTTYTLTGKDANNCTTTQTVVINVISSPTANAGLSQTITCTSPTVSLSGSGVTTYTWSGPGILSGANSPNPVVNASGTYSLVGTSGSCNSTNNATVSVITNTTAPSLTITAAQGTICVGSSVILTASGANTYSWNTGPTTTTINVTPSVTTVYNVSGTNTANGCTAGISKTITVIANPTVTISGTNIICSGQLVNLTAGGASTYSWNTGATTNTIAPTPTANTTYTVIGTSGSCTNSAVQSVTVNTLPTVNASTSNSVICGPPYQGTATINASGASTYTWNTSATTNSISVSPSVTTTYTVTGTDANGCQNAAIITQSVSACTGVDQLAGQSSEFTIFPNPTSGIFKIYFSNEEVVFEIYNSIGERIYPPIKNTDKNSIEIDCSGQANGVYFVRVLGKNTIAIRKIVKQ